MKWHYLEQYIASTQHKVSVNLIGAGGTGSHMLTNLAAINHSLIALGRQPLFVRVWDPDIVSETNIGRQTFSPSDIDQFKAEVLVTRINRFYGTQWHAIPEYYIGRDFNQLSSNIVISCVDSVKSRKIISNVLSKDNIYSNRRNRPDYTSPYYWMDIGNGKNTGQIILGTVQQVKQPKSEKGHYCKANLPTFFNEFPDVQDDITAPSCSMSEALAHQDLFINKTMAAYAGHMLWDLLKNFRINYRGLYVNMNDMKISKIPI